MKKIVSLGLAGLMLLSACPMVYAADVDYQQGTAVSYTADADNNGDGISDAEYYEVTVPASLAPGSKGTVTASGTWASNRKLTVSADASVRLTNSINNADYKDLTITFPSIELAGSNTAAVTQSAEVAVAAMPSDALFGTWSGAFNYTVEMGDIA